MNLGGYCALRKTAREGMVRLLGLSLIVIAPIVLTAAQGGSVMGRLVPVSDFPELPTSMPKTSPIADAKSLKSKG